MPIRAVIFDVGGVLELNPPTGWVERWAERLGLAPSELTGRLDELWDGGDVGAVSLPEVERRTAAGFGLDERALAAFMGDVWAEYVGSLNQPMARFVESLRPRVRTGILSNSFVGAREREQAAHGFAERFDAIVYSHEVGHRKPDPAIYAIACERLRVAPHEALFVDDLEVNVEAARAFGMHAIAFVDTEQAIRDVSAHLDGGPSSERSG